MQFSTFLGSISFLFYKFVNLKLKSIFIMGSMFGYAAIYNVIGIFVPENFPVYIRGNVMGFIIIIVSFAPLPIPLLTNILKQNVDYIFIIFGVFSGIVLNFIDETLGKPISEIIPEENENNLKDSFLKFEKN